MRPLLLLMLFIKTVLFATVTQDSNLSEEANLTKTEIPIFYKDYAWDIGVIGGLTFDGAQIDYQRYTLGAGLKMAYHYNESITFHGEYVKYFKSFVPSKYGDKKSYVDKETRTNIVAASVAYDFSADRPYSLFAKAGLGYEFKDDADAVEQKSAVSLMGFGFRYMFTDYVSAYLEGRWKMRLNDISQPDSSLIGTVGVDYHFGLSDEKKKLIKEANKHNVWVDEQLKN